MVGLWNAAHGYEKVWGAVNNMDFFRQPVHVWHFSGEVLHMLCNNYDLAKQLLGTKA